MKCPACRTENDPEALRCFACGGSMTAAPSALVVTVDLSAGTLFHSRYEILGPLGRGGMGMVYKAHDRTLDETVAIKILRPDFAQDPRMAQRFKSESKLARKVRHKNVCAIHDFGEEQGLLFISMELIEGTDLKRVVKEQGALPPDRAFDVAIQVADGLQAVHEAGIIHRDLKTPNIMLDPRGVARLMDFGVAKLEAGETSATASGHVLGTPDYMSPEQAQGEKVDFRCDIYALGIVIYEIFAGRVPFRGDTPLATLLKQIHDAPPLEGPEAAPIPDPLRPVLRRALAKEPAYRYASAGDLADALRKAREACKSAVAATAAFDTPTLTAVRPVTDPLRRPALPRADPAPPRRRVRRVTAALSVVALASAAVLLAAALLARRDAPKEAAAALASAVPSTVPIAASSPAPDPPFAATAAPPPVEASAPPTPEAPRRTPPPRPAPRIAEQKAASAASPVASPPVASPPATPTPSATATPAPTPVPAAAAVSTASAPAEPGAASPSPPQPEQSRGLLQVSVIPWGNVFVDGKLVGTTPMDKIELSAGRHTVRFEHPSYLPIEGDVTIQPGKLSKLAFDFPKNGMRKAPKPE
jgi:serine/threonine-protein kinase